MKRLGDPIAAIYRYRRYLELRPDSEAAIGRGFIEERQVVAGGEAVAIANRRARRIGAVAERQGGAPTGKRDATLRVAELEVHDSGRELTATADRRQPRLLARRLLVYLHQEWRPNIASWRRQWARLARRHPGGRLRPSGAYVSGAKGDTLQSHWLCVITARGRPGKGLSGKIRAACRTGPVAGGPAVGDSVVGSVNRIVARLVC